MTTEAEIADLDSLRAFIEQRNSQSLRRVTEPIYVSQEAMAAIMADPRIVSTFTAGELKKRSFRYAGVPILAKPPGR